MISSLFYRVIQLSDRSDESGEVKCNVYLSEGAAVPFDPRLLQMNHQQGVKGFHLRFRRPGLEKGVKGAVIQHHPSARHYVGDDEVDEILGQHATQVGDDGIGSNVVILVGD